MTCTENTKEPIQFHTEEKTSNNVQFSIIVLSSSKCTTLHDVLISSNDKVTDNLANHLTTLRLESNQVQNTVDCFCAPRNTVAHFLD